MLWFSICLVRPHPKRETMLASVVWRVFLWRAVSIHIYDKLGKCERGSEPNDPRRVRRTLGAKWIHPAPAVPAQLWGAALRQTRSHKECTRALDDRQCSKTLRACKKERNVPVSHLPESLRLLNPDNLDVVKVASCRPHNFSQRIHLTLLDDPALRPVDQLTCPTWERAPLEDEAGCQECARRSEFA